MSARVRTTATAVIAVSTVLLTAACSGSPLPLAGSASSPAPAATRTVTVTPSATPSTTPAGTTSPVADPSPSPGGTPSFGPGGIPVAHPCSNGRTAIPAGAVTARIGDVDRDGKRDTEFMVERPNPQYGIRTAAGGVYTIDVPTGPGRSSGWTATDFDGPLVPVTVVDDGREADLYTFAGCGFVRVRTPSGAPFVFPLASSGVAGPGTGVACTDQNGGQLLARADAVQRKDGRYDVRWTVVQFTDRYAHADYETPAETRYSGLHEEDPPVVAAERSACLDTPVVRTSGR